jgi:hypothetical protein
MGFGMMCLESRFRGGRNMGYYSNEIFGVRQ